MTSPRRLLALTGSLTCAVALLLPAAPATASPQTEAAILTSMQSAWTDLSRKDQRRTCAAYRLDARELVTSSVASIWADEDNRAGLTRAEWRRVIRQYLAWACSGPGTTPR